MDAKTMVIDTNIEEGEFQVEQEEMMTDEGRNVIKACIFTDANRDLIQEILEHELDDTIEYFDWIYETIQYIEENVSRSFIEGLRNVPPTSPNPSKP
jgi:hypothetical protein